MPARGEGVPPGGQEEWTGSRRVWLSRVVARSVAREWARPVIVWCVVARSSVAWGSLVKFGEVV